MWKPSAAERRAADLFWNDLVGRPAVPYRRPAAPVEVIAEASPQLSGSPPVVVAVPARPRPTYPDALIRQSGIDVYQENNVPSWNDVRDAGIAFVIHRCSIGRNLDTEFAARYPGIRTAGLIRGSYHYYLHRNGDGGDVQADRVVAAVQRLGPGDLAPSLDFEEAAVASGSTEPATAAAWRTELEAFLDTVETKLGRTPLIYTRRGPWRSHLGNKADYRAADFAHFGNYPLWVLNYALRFQPRNLTATDPATGTPTTITVNFNPDNDPRRTDPVFPAGAVGDDLFRQAKAEFRRQAWSEAERLYGQRQTINPPAAALPEPWRTWSLFQYSPFTPDSMRQHGFPTDFKVDFNVTRGGIYFLRGLADLGRTAPHLVGNLNCVAYTEPDGSIHLLEYVSGSWIDQNVARDMAFAATPPPPAIGDPSAAAVGNEQVIVYRSARGVHVLTRNIATADARWTVTTVTGGVAAFGDPFVFVFRNNIHLVYWDQADAHAHVSRVNGVWQSESLADRPGAANAQSRISGSAAAYVHQNALHIVSRSRDAGHLFDFVAGGGAAPQDLTAASRPADGQTPAATYRPTTYTRSGQAARIVFRALRGQIWEIERDTLAARSLGAAAAAPIAAGSPTAVVGQAVHILYRSVDGRIHEIFDDAGAWRSRQVCPDAVAVSDPSAYIDERGHVAATFRTTSGPIHLARFVNGRWTCQDLP